MVKLHCPLVAVSCFSTWPAGQHTGAPLTVAVVPLGQVLHADAPVAAANFPLSHGVQTFAVPSDAVPAGQAAHELLAQMHLLAVLHSPVLER